MSPRQYRPIPAAAVRRLRQKLLAWYRRHGAEFLWRQRPTPYRVLVAEVMLQQTQVSRVEPKYRAWLRRYPTLRALAGATTRELLTLWSGLGYNRRALSLRDCARVVAARHGGRLPHAFSALLALPGIGPYTAHAVNIFARNRDEVCVDTNVRRVLIHELKLPPDCPPARVEQVAWQALPKGRSREWHNALMDYGRIVATGRATGVRSVVRRPQPFLGSSRYYRGRLIAALVRHRFMAWPALARQVRLPIANVKKIAAALARDGLVVVRPNGAGLPR
ncbi:MAG: Fe-S cluster assembly protein HesB [bacterium]|nr:Fe-S cluster assembly protein HesB [bacterium]